MKNKTIFVACDTSNLEKIKKIISQTKTNKLKIIPKFGLQFYYSKHGRKFLEKIKDDFWLDLKINDIPQTALSAIDSLKDLKNCKYITVHANGGLQMLKAVKKKAKKINKNLKVLCVTVLTSLNDEDTAVIFKRTSSEQVEAMLDSAESAGIHGVVCSPHELHQVKKRKSLLSNYFELLLILK